MHLMTHPQPASEVRFATLFYSIRSGAKFLLYVSQIISLKALLNAAWSVYSSPEMLA